MGIIFCQSLHEEACLTKYFAVVIFMMYISSSSATLQCNYGQILADFNFANADWLVKYAKIYLPWNFQHICKMEAIFYVLIQNSLWMWCSWTTLEDKNCIASINDSAYQDSWLSSFTCAVIGQVEKYYRTVFATCDNEVMCSWCVCLIHSSKNE